VGASLGAGAWAEVSASTVALGVDTPSITSPSNGAVDQMGSVTITSSAFGWSGLSDTHASSDWQLATDAGFTSIVSQSTADTSNLTSWDVSGLSTSQTYYVRVRHNGTNNGSSEWSAASSFATAATFGGLIGAPGTQGFGVGVATNLPSGFSEMTGTTDPASDNYGNYQYTDGSIMCFVPRFYYRIGHASNPTYGDYGANSIDVKGIDTYADEAAANAAGYAMHRAFIDGGQVLDGFFYDKYLASKDGSTSCKSVKNGVPISLTTDANYTNSNGMVTPDGTCTGILADAVMLSRARGAGFHCHTVFQVSAVALLSLAHAQASSSSTHCAWYDAAGTTNYPKGCNNNALSDVDDSGVTFATAGDSGNANKPQTGSGSPFAKTTHNGQSCGIADVNGSMFQVALGITSPGSSATDTAQVASGDVYALKESVAAADLKAGWNSTNDAWGNAAHLATLYDLQTGLLPWGSATGAVYFGNGTNQVFDEATSGAGWLRTACGIQQDTDAMSASGTSLFGQDYCYQYNRANLFVPCAGHWSFSVSAGVFYRHWRSSRSIGSTIYGWRAARPAPSS